MIRKKRKAKIIIIPVCIVAFALLLYQKMAYKCDYMNELGISPDSHRYNHIIEEFGEPDNIEENVDGMWEYVLDYTDKKFYFVYSVNGNIPFVRVDVLDDSYKFGWRRVQVGMSRKTIEKIYKNNQQILENDQECFGIIDEFWYIYFHFDKEDILTEIHFCDGL